MSKTDPSPFVELSDYWFSITRKDYPTRGFGKWTLFSEEPHWLEGKHGFRLVKPPIF